jgi:hypothetical protein
MSWLVLALAAPLLSCLGVAIWRLTARIFGRGVRMTWLEQVAAAVKPEFDRVHAKLDDFRVENERDHAKVRERLSGIDGRLDGIDGRLVAVEQRLRETHPVQVVVNPGGASAQT